MNKDRQVCFCRFMAFQRALRAFIQWWSCILWFCEVLEIETDSLSGRDFTKRIAFSRDVSCESCPLRSVAFLAQAIMAQEMAQVLSSLELVKTRGAGRISTHCYFQS